MRVQEDGLFIKGSIGNIATDFMFDTGGGISVISNNLYQLLKASLLYKCPITGFQHDGERLDGSVYTAPVITIGNFTLHHVPLLVWPELDNYGLNAIISLQPFATQPVSLDFVNKQFIIENEKTLHQIAVNADIIAIKIDYYRDLMLDVFVPLRLNNTVTIDAELDTGTPASNLLIHPQYLPSLIADTTGIEKQIYQQKPNGEIVYDKLHIIPVVAYAGSAQLSERNKKASFREGLIYNGLIGAGMFMKHKLTIDIVHHRMFVNKL